MSDQKSKKRLPPLVRLAFDLGPLILFFMLAKQFYLATAIFIPLATASFAITYWYERRISVMPAVTLAVVLVFGGLTLYLHNETFFKMKPTIIYAIFAIILTTGILTQRNFLKVVFDQAFHLPETAWRTLTWRWISFFVAMALANEFVWRNYSTEFWAGYKLFGAIPLFFLFTLSQTPFLLKHHRDEDAPETS